MSKSPANGAAAAAVTEEMLEAIEVEEPLSPAREEAALVELFASHSLFDETHPEALLDKSITQVSDKFLSSLQVTTPCTLADVAGRFHNTTMRQKSATAKSAGAYFDKLVSQGVVKDSVNVSSPQMIGHMTTSLPYYSRPLAKLITSLNQNVVKTETAKTVTFIEREALAQLHRQIYDNTDEFYIEHVQNPNVMLGVFTSGGTVANLTALWIARNSNLPPKGDFKSVERDGWVSGMMTHGYTGAVIIGSELMHYSLNKAADMLGLGLKGLKKIPVDDSYQVDLEAMEATIKECIEKKILIVAMVGICGATETGAIDPLEEMAALSEKYDLHFHVDAAWGGPNIFSKSQRDLIKGIECADTVTLDGHKQLYLPLGAGMCFMKEPSACHSIRKTANYIIRKESHDLGKFTIEGSRPAMGLFLHANLNILGVRGYEVLIDRSVRMARFMAALILKSRNFELLVKPMANILLYRYVPVSLRDAMWEGDLTDEQNEIIDDINRRLQDKQKLAGFTFVSRTTIRCPKYSKPIVGLRIVIGNPLTTEQDIETVVSDQLKIVMDVTEDCDSTPTLVGQPGASKANEGNWTAFWDSMPAKQKTVFKNKDTFYNSLANWNCKFSAGSDETVTLVAASQAEEGDN